MTSETIKVLLIAGDEDDYILTRELFSLVKVGTYVLDWASSYEEGLKVAERREHQVCLVDYRLGERSGVELIREARESRLTTPMILLTVQNDHDLDARAMEAGATDYLVKDETSPARLERTIRYAVRLNTERCRGEEELAAYARKQSAVAEIGHLALTGGQIKDLFTEAVALVARTLEVEYSNILELLPDGDTLLLRAGVGWKKEYLVGEATVPAGKESQAGFTLLSDEPVVVEDLRTEARFSGPPLLHEHGVLSGMTVIIRGRKRPYGVLGAHTTSLRGFATDEVDFLRTVSNVLADAIHRKNAEEELRQSEARFRRVVESNILGIIYWDASGAITGANDAFLKMVGYTREELIGGRMRWTDMTPRKYRKLDKRAFGDLATSGICETYEKEYIRKDGSRVAVLLGCAILEGEKQGGVGFVLDITERKQTENALRESNEKFHQLADNITDAFWIRSPDFREVHYISPAFERIWGCTVESLYANPQQWVDFILPEDRDRVLAVFETLTEASPSVSIEYQIARPDGEIRWIDVRGFQVRDAAGELIRLTGIVTDVTEQVLSRRRLKETEEQLRQSQKLESVGMLAGGIAHDFNNLLTVITGYSDLTLGRLDRADPLARNVEAIKKAAERATSLTSQLLAFSRKQMLQPKVLDLNSVIVNIEKMLGLLVGEHMELCTSRGVGLGRVKADPGQIEQVILNLVVNARDAMPKGGKITLETANIYLDEAYVRRHIAVQPGWYAMLAVTDTGHGMDADTQKNIFEPFFTTKEQGKGTGLGLSTVYGIVKQSGGNIWVYSEVGLGTTFKIYLPLVDEQVTEPEADAARLESAAGTETILLAEDEELVRKLATESLKMHGYTVLEAANGGEALRISQQHDGPIHLLLTDMVMPRMGGKELADQLLGLRPDMRVLYMSGYTEQAIVHHGILDVDIAFIGKPFTPDALVLKVIEVLNANSKVLTVA